LRFILITMDASFGSLENAPSTAEVISTDAGSFAIAVSASDNAKCVRCWHQREDVGTHQDHPELCGRCIENVDGSGEERRIA